MKCTKCGGEGYIHLYPEDVFACCCDNCVLGEEPAYRELWLCFVHSMDYAFLLRGKQDWYYYDAALGGWYVVDGEVEPMVRMVQHGKAKRVSKSRNHRKE